MLLFLYNYQLFNSHYCHYYYIHSFSLFIVIVIHVINNYISLAITC